MIATERLVIRPWRDADRAPFARMGQDPEVMAHLGPLWDEARCAEMIARQQHWQRNLGHCFWAIERRADAAFLGFCGIKPGRHDTPIGCLPEIGWRLSRSHWGQGYAREAAAACLSWAWASTPWRAVYALTAPGNIRSWGLMERLGMERRDDLAFDDPYFPEGDPLRATITYVIHRPEGR
ncbi:MAG: GNAT family N-acetyltransferase [Sphingomonadaceae bacterium]